MSVSMPKAPAVWREKRVEALKEPKEPAWGPDACQSN